MTKFHRYIAFCWILIIIIIILLFKISGNKWKETVSPGLISNSISTSIKDQRFIDTVHVFPQSIVLDSFKYEIMDCWVQQIYKMNYKYIFFRTNEYIDRYILCFTLNKNDLQDNLQIRFIDKGVTEGSFLFSGENSVYSYSLDSIDNKALKGIMSINGKQIDTIRFILSDKIIRKIYER